MDKHLGWLREGEGLTTPLLRMLHPLFGDAQCALAIQHFFRLLWTDVTWRSPHLTVKDTISNRLFYYLDK